MERKSITELCDLYYQSSIGEGGVTMISPGMEKYRLYANGYVMHALSFDELLETIGGLSKVFLLKRMTASVSTDHYRLWAWCGQIAKFDMASNRAGLHRDLKFFIDQVTCICNISSVGSNLSPSSYLNNHFSRYDQTLPYLAFPMLELLLKSACHEYVTPDGGVIKAFGTNDRYKPGKKSSQCSSLKDYLDLYVSLPVSERIRPTLEAIKLGLEEVTGTDNAFKTIYDWRNGNLHGSRMTPTIGGILINICFLIAVNRAAGSYEEHRRFAAQTYEEIHAGGERPFWAHYPPLSDKF